LDRTGRLKFLSTTYFGPTGDELLEQLNITTHSGGTSLAQFGYTYNTDDNVKSLAVSAPTAQTTTYAYDTANRLVSGLIGTGSPQYVYGYDHASNLTSITPNGAAESFSYTSTNTITGQTYDANGSPTVLSGNSYKWDGENRIVRFASSANNTGSSFTYDGLGRLVRVVDTHGGAITADHSYTWCGNVRCLAHDNTQGGSPVSTQYFDQGAIISGTSYYYVKDELGSVRQLVTSTGTVASQYTYDPYGNQTTVSGTASDIGYAGYFHHAVSGLDFTHYRAYDPTHARWLNRDPIGEAGGVNLYAYVSGSPVSYLDSQGTTPIGVAIGLVGGFSFGVISSLIEGKSFEAALINGGEDAVVGGLIGLTDGLSLVPILTRSAISGATEAIKEEVHGCGPDSTKISFAVAAGALGDFGGEVAAGAISSAATQASHYVTEAAGWVAPAVGTAISGSGEVFQSFIERTSHF
jgi:RHS repeat-associated protein